MKALARDLVDRMPQLTAIKSMELALANTRENLAVMGRTIADLVTPAGEGREGAAIVVGAGPSLHKRDPVSQVLASGFTGEVICADGALPYCLRNGLVPDYVVSVDPNHTRIVRWFGDPSLDEARLQADDYFRRQDLDPYLDSDELEKNREVTQLVDKHAPAIKGIIATCASPAVANRCIQAGFDIYWWNPLYDDISEPGSLSRQVYEMNKAPCMGTGGNTGSAAWVFANMVLRKKEIALVGMDFGYAPGTPLLKTQYYTELLDLYGDNVRDAYIDVENPYTNEVWLTDPAYYWFRQVLLQMAKDADCATYNCTEGGILFGEGLEYSSLSGFLGKWAKREENRD